MSHAYYNEHDPFAAQWLRNLMTEGLIAPGDVDERDIRDVRADDLAGYGQCHFFAGIGGWSYALCLAGWPDDRPVWTGSPPCQPFSAAGQRKGLEDERHLWPAFFDLIRERRPATVIGEQVASPAALGWWDFVQDDLEGAGYACAAFDLCSAGGGGAHIRQRLYWLADAHGRNAGAEGLQRGRQHGFQPEDGGADRGVEHALGGGWGRGQASSSRYDGEWTTPVRQKSEHGPGGASACGVFISDPHATDGLRSPADWLFCRDGKWRPVEPGTFPLADGIPARVGRLRAYGNAIDPLLAAEFIASYLDVKEGAP